MKVTYKNGLPVVPKGWRKLRLGSTLKIGDRYDIHGDWVETSNDGEVYCHARPWTYIRKKGTK